MPASATPQPLIQPTADHQPPPVAVIGLGAMGSGIASWLAESGHLVHATDVDPAARTRVPAAVQLHDHLTDLAACPVWILSLPGPAQIRQVIEQLLDADDRNRPRTVVDTSTSDPALSSELAARCDDRGIDYVDAPVSGGRSGASTGTLTAFVGGSEAGVERARSTLDAITGGQWHYMGPAGTGHTTKLVNNMLCAAHLTTAAEAVALAQQRGISVDRLIGAINHGSGRSAVTETNYPRWVLPGSFDSGFQFQLMARDVRLFLDVAARTGIDPRVLAAAGDRWAAAADQLDGDDDFNRVVGTIRP